MCPKPKQFKRLATRDTLHGSRPNLRHCGLDGRILPTPSDLSDKGASTKRYARRKKKMTIIRIHIPLLIALFPSLSLRTIYVDVTAAVVLQIQERYELVRRRGSRCIRQLFPGAIFRVLTSNFVWSPLKVVSNGQTKFPNTCYLARKNWQQVPKRRQNFPTRHTAHLASFWIFGIWQVLSS